MENFLTIADVAEYLNISANQVRSLIREGDIPAFQVGKRGQWRISPDALENYIRLGHELTRQKVASGWKE